MSISSASHAVPRPSLLISLQSHWSIPCTRLCPLVPHLMRYLVPLLLISLQSHWSIPCTRLCPLAPHLMRHPVLLCLLLPHLMRHLALFVHSPRISCGYLSPSLLSISSASHAAPCPSLSITPASHAAPCPSLSITPESHSGTLPLMVNPPLNLIRVSLKEHYSPAKNINTRLHDEKILVPINKKQYFCGKIQLIPCCY